MMKKIRVSDIPLPAGKPPSKSKPLVKVSGLLIGLTAVVSVWMMYEVGLLKFSRVSAAEKPETVEVSGMEALQRSVQEREKSVQEKEEAMKQREAALTDKETALNEQIKNYEKTVQALKQRLAALESKPDEKPDEFLSIYEKMEAKRAAKIFEKLDLPLATRLLKKMSPGRAAEILGLMPSDRARVLTERHLAHAPAPANRENILGQ